MSEVAVGPIKAFVSYSWSSPSHEEWVLSLASRMVEDGVEVILDKWELQPGRDPIVFMEQMVTNPDVKKVLMVCDRVYKEKADGREGGVGKEAQILTAEIYEKTAEDKYAALITERDEEGKPYVPTYYHSRQYIDFTDAVQHEQKYQELLRWIFDKPQHKKPKLGKAPSFITEPDSVTTATTSKAKQAEQFIKAGNAAAAGAITDFGDAIIQEFEDLRPVRTEDEPWDEVVLRTAASLRPAIRNLSVIVVAEARHAGVNLERILSVFEKLGSFMYRPDGVNSWREDDFDHYRMMCYEGFLALTAILLKEGRFDLLSRALTHAYLVQGRERSGAATATYRVFCRDVPSYGQRNARLSANRVDMYADEIAEVYQSSFPSFAQMVQADLILFLRGQIIADSSGYENWWGRLLIYGGQTGLAELFARSESRSYFDSWAPMLLGTKTVEELKEKVAEVNKESGHTWRSGFMGPRLTELINYEHIGQRQ